MIRQSSSFSYNVRLSDTARRSRDIELCHYHQKLGPLEDEGPTFGWSEADMRPVNFLEQFR